MAGPVRARCESLSSSPLADRSTARIMVGLVEDSPFKG
ncbi:hypothetical protein F4561_002114 [Lipingzhangella halophila]|uniref:Uncharacterized protein n=1 Tax=Lipingzhangella halophila TaxID=1783352 RepID=A0A7W7RG21_9ACTN|nr:hypothetical protein [Lipingzhangella halophila]